MECGTTEAQREAAGSGLSSLRKEEAELLHQTQEIAALKEQNQTELKDSESMEKCSHLCSGDLPETTG